MPVSFSLILTNIIIKNLNFSIQNGKFTNDFTSDFKTNSLTTRFKSGSNISSTIIRVVEAVLLESLVRGEVGRNVAGL